MLHSSRKLLREEVAYCFCSFDKVLYKFGDIGANSNVVCYFTHPSSYYHSLSCWENTRERFSIGRRNFSSSAAHHKFASPKPAILQASSLRHWFKNWQEKRRHRLTASTFGQAIGFWPRRRVQLWLEKIGAIEGFSGNLATCWNNIKEQEALERYRLLTGNSVSLHEFQAYGERNLEDDWLGASPDGAIDGMVYGVSSRGVLEIKCPFNDGDLRRASPWRRIPLYCMPQAQGLMEIMDRDWMDLYCWTPIGSSLFRIRRDPLYWDAMKIALLDFWWKNVQPAREIYSNSVISEPLWELREFRPAPRHELCPYIVYESKQIVDDSKLLFREINGRRVD